MSHRTPASLWGMYVPPQSLHRMAQLHAQGQPEGTALAVAHRARAGLLWWHNKLIPVLVMLPRGGLLSPLTEAVGPWLVAMGTQRSCGSWQQGGLAFTRAGNLSPLVVTNPCCKRGWVGGHG